jgi:hypothetical protein
MTQLVSPWFGRKFTHSRIPPEAVAWRLACVDAVIAREGNLADAAEAWGLSQSAQVSSFLALRSPERLDALRSGYRRSALSREAYLARCVTVALGAKLGLSRPEVARLLEISPNALTRWARSNGAEDDIVGMFREVTRIQTARLAL